MYMLIFCVFQMGARHFKASGSEHRWRLGRSDIRHAVRHEGKGHRRAK